jgi:hypothetical protein
MTSSIVILVLLVALVPIVLFFGALGEQKRREAMERLATEQGLAFKPDGDFVPKVLAHFELFQRGRGRMASNVLEDVSDAQAFWVFDYKFTVGGGRNRRTHRQTVVAFPYLDVNLPAFTVRREHLFHKLGTIFGYQDIDFPEHPSFSTRHLVRGKDERAVRSLFDGHLICAVDAIDHVCIEGAGSCLLVFRDGKTIKPEKVMEFVGQAQALCDAFVGRADELGWKQKHSAEPASVYDG